MKKILIIILGLFLLTGCGNKDKQNPIVTMEIENYGTIKMELYPEYAPNTVANFVNLIESGFYDDNNFHRLVTGFALQGGDSTGTGTGGPGYYIKGEFSENNYVNELKHTEGIISMARSNSYNSAGSQFFIVLATNASVTYSLDGKYAAFGKVIEGMDIIKQIESNEEIIANSNGLLKEKIKIVKTTVDTFGEKYKVKKISK